MIEKDIGNIKSNFMRVSLRLCFNLGAFLSIASCAFTFLRILVFFKYLSSLKAVSPSDSFPPSRLKFSIR